MRWVLDYYGVYVWLIVAILLLYKRLSYDYWQKLNIKSLKPVPFFGNTAEFVFHRKTYHQVLQDLYAALGDEPFGGIYQMRDPYLLVKDPKLVSSVLIANFKFFSSRGPLLYFSQKAKSKGAVAMNVALASGERWKMLRQKMSSAFTAYRVNRMYEQVSYCAGQLVEFVDKRMDAAESTKIDTKNLAEKYSVEVIGLCFFGIRCHSFEGDRNEFVEMCDHVFTTQSVNIIRLIVSVFSKRLWHKLNLPDVNRKVTNFFADMTLDVVGHRRRHRTTRNDFLQVIMNMQNSHVDPKFHVAKSGQRVTENEEFNELDIATNAFVLYLAAYETSSTTLSFCLYELALNENIQEKLRAEVQRVRDQYVELNYNSLKEMTYMDAVIAETLRKYPPAPTVTRQCVEDFVIPETNIRIPAGTNIVIPVWSIHHDSRYYSNPELFDPERFTGDRKYKQSNGIYLPFGDGPRICFGKNFAEMELKAVISSIISKYNIKPCAETEIPVKFSGGSLPLHTSHKMWLSFTKRKTEAPFSNRKFE